MSNRVVVGLSCGSSCLKSLQTYQAKYQEERVG